MRLAGLGLEVAMERQKEHRYRPNDEGLPEPSNPVGGASGFPGGTLTRSVEPPPDLWGRMATGATSVTAEIASGIGRSARSVRHWLFGKSDDLVGCFVPGTPVVTPTGSVPIEALVVGDEIVAQDPQTGRVTTELVAKVMTRSIPITVDIAAGSHLITCSPEHPFWVAGQGWNPAGSLRVGHQLHTVGGRDVPVDAVQRRPGSGWTVRNIAVPGPHTYHVGALGVLVHNKAMEADFVPRQRVLPPAPERSQPRHLPRRPRRPRRPAARWHEGSRRRSREKPSC